MKQIELSVMEHVMLEHLMEQTIDSVEEDVDNMESHIASGRYGSNMRVCVDGDKRRLEIWKSILSKLENK